jgi:hypothetical protein
VSATPPQGGLTQALGLGINHLTTTEIQLLDNVLDALDRLYDEKLQVIDLWALLLATSEAMRHTAHFNVLAAPIEDLLAIVRSGESDDIQRDRALLASDWLRHYLANLLPIG